MVESHAHISRRFFGDNLVECVTEPHDGRRIEPFRVDARVFYEGVIRAIDQRIGVDKKESIHNSCDYIV